MNKTSNNETGEYSGLKALRAVIWLLHDDDEEDLSRQSQGILIMDEPTDPTVLPKQIEMWSKLVQNLTLMKLFITKRPLGTDGAEMKIGVGSNGMLFHTCAAREGDEVWMLFRCVAPMILLREGDNYQVLEPAGMDTRVERSIKETMNKCEGSGTCGEHKIEAISLI